MPRDRWLHLQKQTTRHKTTVWYVRRGHGKRHRIKAEFGTPEFEAEYFRVIIGMKSPLVAPPPSKGSLAWLWEQYNQTSAWTDLSAATRRQRENIMSHVLAAVGQDPFEAVTEADLEASRDRRTATQGRNFLDAMRGMFRWAKKAQHAKADPTAGVKNPERKKGPGFLAWEEADVARYEARWAAGTRQRVWLHVLLYIGCRRGDAVLLGKQHVKAGVITFVTEKGRNRERIEVSRRLEPELVATLARGPCSDLAFICGERGMPLTKESFGNDFKDSCVAADIPDKSAHGLRKLSATLWAERGATEWELMAMFGWLTPAMAALYTRTARRKKMALHAHDRLMGTGN